ncbi:MAG: hypothetical protein P1U42_05800 [Phycisphaerales bacterium]|nr:hypothetical protein [Phycisphaerales bacterium]
MIISHITILSEQLAQLSSDPSRQEAYRRGYSMILMLSLLGILFIGMLTLIIVLRRARQRKESQPKADSTVHVDAWAESGKRFDTSITEIDVSEDEID